MIILLIIFFTKLPFISGGSYHSCGCWLWIWLIQLKNPVLLAGSSPLMFLPSDTSIGDSKPLATPPDSWGRGLLLSGSCRSQVTPRDLYSTATDMSAEGWRIRKCRAWSQITGSCPRKSTWQGDAGGCEGSNLPTTNHRLAW